MLVYIYLSCYMLNAYLKPTNVYLTYIVMV